MVRAKFVDAAFPKLRKQGSVNLCTARTMKEHDVLKIFAIVYDTMALLYSILSSN